MTHKTVIVVNGDWGRERVSEEDCDGKISYDKVLEGNVCDKCDYYDRVK